MKRLAVARFCFAGNAFSSEPTTLDSCLRQQWLLGEEALAGERGSTSELAAVEEFAASHPDWEISVLRCAAALPAGPVDEALFARISSEICAPLADARFDAVYVSLHGAAITGERTSADHDLLHAVRQSIGATPLAASFAFNANIHPAIAGIVDFASGARTAAASDLHHTASRVLRQLARISATGARLHCAIASTGMVLPGIQLRTDGEPMAGLLLAARAAERDGVADISLFGGFPYADSPQCAAKVMAWAETAERARQTADALATEWLAHKPALRAVLPGPNVALGLALAAPAGLVAVTDPADDPGSGGAADSTTLFRALLEMRQTDPVVFAYFDDAALVEQAREAGIGGSFRARIGARTSREFGAGVEAMATVLRLTDGRFCNRGPLEHGMQQDCGSSALLEVGGVKTIITSRRVRADDPAFFELHGIDLARTRLLCVKAKARFRAAFDPLCRQIIDCDAPGPAAADLRSLPFKNIRMR